jgi:HlyD family secretion protein
MELLMLKKKKIIIFVVIVIGISIMIFIQTRKGRANLIEVSTVEVKRGNITKTVSGSGYIQPDIDVDISARISSEIIRIHIKEGDRVTKGQLLAELDRQRYEASVEQAESQRMSAQASLKKAEADFARIDGLFKQNLSTQADLDAVEAQKLSAESQVQQADAYLRQARDDLAKTRLIAPIAGVVTKLFKEEGEIAVGSQFQADPVMTVSDLGVMEVLAEVDENDVVMISNDDSAKIEVDAIPDTIFKGRVTEIAHTATTRNRGTQEQVTNFEVKVRVTNPTEKLRPGMSATVDISTETHKNVLYIPFQCVTTRDTTKAAAKQSDKNPPKEETASSPKTTKESSKPPEVVFVVENGNAKMISVKTGLSSDTDVEVMSGPTEGQKVVSGNYKALSRLLKDGSAVKEKKETKPADEKESD